MVYGSERKTGEQGLNSSQEDSSSNQTEPRTQASAALRRRARTMGYESGRKLLMPSGRYLVERGDTLWEIAQRFLGDGSRWKEIAQANGISDPRALRAGQEIVVPGWKGDAGGRQQAQDKEQERKTETTTSSSTSSGTKASARRYVVRRGDTLWEIAQRFLGDGSRWKEIAQANGISDPRALRAGQEIVVPGWKGDASGRQQAQDKGQERKTETTTSSFTSSGTNASALSVSEEGLQVIERFEGFVDHPYNDPAGYATIGYGHLLHKSPVTEQDKKKWGTITKAQGRALLKQDVGWAEQAVRTSVTVPLTQSMYDALVSFVFNVGAGAFRSSTLLRKLNHGDYRGAADEFMKWVHAGRKRLPGLVRRRGEERELFLRDGLPSQPGHKKA